MRDTVSVPGSGSPPGGGSGSPPFLPGESHGQRSLAGCSPGGRTESDLTEVTQHTHWSIAALRHCANLYHTSESVVHVHASPLFWLSFLFRSPVPLNLPGLFLYFPARTALNELCNFVIRLFTLCIHPLAYRLWGSGRALVLLFLLTGASLTSRTGTEPA